MNKIELLEPDPACAKMRGLFICRLFEATEPMWSRWKRPHGKLVRLWQWHNGWTTVGLNYLENCALGAAAQLTTFYMGLIDGTTTPTLAPSDTMAVHSGWTENPTYSGGARPAWTPGSASGGIITNPATVNFTASSGITIAGAFIVSDPTLSGTAGTLICTAKGPTSQALTTGQVLQITYALQITPTN
jgi:hypothetical protein